MRAIKFRMWTGTSMLYDVSNVYECLKQQKGFDEGIQLSRQLGVIPYDHIGDGSLFLQFTGLKDKNGKEIYEGDIIQFKSYWVNKRWWSDTKEIPEIEKQCEAQRQDVSINKHQVVFKDGGFHLGYSISFKDVARGEKFERGRSHWCDTESKSWDFEVIGNVYENPDLLK